MHVRVAVRRRHALRAFSVIAQRQLLLLLLLVGLGQCARMQDWAPPGALSPAVPVSWQLLLPTRLDQLRGRDPRQSAHRIEKRSIHLTALHRPRPRDPPHGATQRMSLLHSAPCAPVHTAGSRRPARRAPFVSPDHLRASSSSRRAGVALPRASSVQVDAASSAPAYPPLLPLDGEPGDRLAAAAAAIGPTRLIAGPLLLLLLAPTACCSPCHRRPHLLDHHPSPHRQVRRGRRVCRFCQLAGARHAAGGALPLCGAQQVQDVRRGRGQAGAAAAGRRHRICVAAGAARGALPRCCALPHSLLYSSVRPLLPATQRRKLSPDSARAAAPASACPRCCLLPRPGRGAGAVADAAGRSQRIHAVQISSRADQARNGRVRQLACCLAACTHACLVPQDASTASACAGEPAVFAFARCC